MAVLSRKYSLFLVLLLIVAGAVVVFSTVSGESRGHQLRVVSYNVGTLNGEKPSLQSILDAIGKKGRPGLVLLQEVPDEAFLLDIGRGLGLDHHVFGAYTAGGGGYGLGILSNRELVNGEMHLLIPNGHAVLLAEMVMDGKRLWVGSVHLERVREVEKKKDGFEVPWGKAFQILKTELISDTPRSMAVEEILSLPALKGSGETIIGGDSGAFGGGDSGWGRGSFSGLGGNRFQMMLARRRPGETLKTGFTGQAEARRNRVFFVFFFAAWRLCARIKVLV